MIDSKDISIVVQGVVDNQITPKCLGNIRKFLPHAEIVLATYIGTDTEGLDFDKLALVEDPGFFKYYDQPKAKPNNINRQIRTTLEGLKASTRKYAFKLRSDFILDDCDFLDFFNKYSNSDPNYKIFENKILAPVFFSRNLRTEKEPLPFHPSDIAFFGLRTDLLNLFDIPLMSKEEALYYKKEKITYCRYVPEQYLWINCLRKNEKVINCEHQKDCNNYIAEEAERYFASNFIFLDYEKFNLIPPKRLTLFCENNFTSIITHVEWQRLYKQYVDSTHHVPEKDELRDKITKNYKKYRVYYLIVKIITLPIRIKSIRHKLRKKLLGYFTGDIRI